MFTGPVHIPILAKGSVTWMSLTPLEVYTLRTSLSVAYGHVLVAGLGMGWLTQKLLNTPGITKITQVELNPKILEFFGKPLKNSYGDKIELVHADVYEYLGSKGLDEFDTFVFDIWPKIFDAREDEYFQEIKNEKGEDEVWGWGDFPLRECRSYGPDETEFENDPSSWYNPENPHDFYQD